MVSLWTHFAAIAGVGPLIGPVLAAQFGYLPGFFLDFNQRRFSRSCTRHGNTFKN